MRPGDSLQQAINRATARGPPIDELERKVQHSLRAGLRAVMACLIGTRHLALTKKGTERSGGNIVC